MTGLLVCTLCQARQSRQSVRAFIDWLLATLWPPGRMPYDVCCRHGCPHGCLRSQGHLVRYCSLWLLWGQGGIRAASVRTRAPARTPCPASSATYWDGS